MRMEQSLCVLIIAALLLGGCSFSRSDGAYEVGLDPEAVGLGSEDADRDESGGRGDHPGQEATGRRSERDPRLAGAADEIAAEDVIIEMETDRDVDTTYTRLRDAFGYKVPDEVAAPGTTKRELLQLDVGYHHRTQPGVSYSMRQHVELDGYEYVMQVDIDKEGEGSRILVGYYTGEDAFPATEAFRKRVKDSVRRALE
ncbi:hypothetical protein QWY84_15385 [Aquisalimonas lutea]|uniref:hypothetical protein n=1 Tax=Aquisalimonas lutea TaxID=1327750 RepID=UPI0025B46E33|nr:hypothetical protein [Aquisalimonas lutea]MDN3519000.1 hypothetical protein [Aquisalimonas lutea]